MHYSYLYSALFYSSFIFLGAPVSVVSASPTTVSWDATYDSPSGSLNTVACSDGDFGLKTIYGWNTFSDIPTFPNIGGAAVVTGWNSPSCGSCWNLTYTPPSPAIPPKSISLLAVDHTSAYGFNIAKSAMDYLTNGRAEELGVLPSSQTTAEQVELSACGIV